MLQSLVLGTRNRKKLAELVELLAPHGIAVHALDEFPAAVEVEEDGATFLANAEKKATQQARRLERWVLGEDSGLVVEALGGRPGVLSARFAAEGAAGNSSDEANNHKLLSELAGAPLERRAAYYVCTAALSDPQGKVHATAEGRCHGRIRLEPAGGGGFGYDPLFEVVEYHRTYGELGPEVKSCLSHRGRAMRAMIPALVALLK